MTINVFHLAWIVPMSVLMGIGGFLWAAAWALGRAEKEQQDLEDEFSMAYNVENEDS